MAVEGNKMRVGEVCDDLAERIARGLQVEAAIQTCQRRGTSEAARASLIRRAKAVHRKFLLRKQQESFAGMMGPAQGVRGVSDWQMAAWP